MKVRDRILEIVSQHNGIRAAKIAKLLKITRKEVNHILYYELQQSCFVDEQYLWRLKEDLSSDALEELINQDLDDPIELAKYLAKISPL